jgi:hypothetical protein
VGNPLTHGLYETCSRQPTDPIKFLGKYLLNQTEWEEKLLGMNETDRLFKEALAKRHAERRQKKEEEQAREAERKRIELEKAEQGRLAKEAAEKAAAAAAEQKESSEGADANAALAPQ